MSALDLLRLAFGLPLVLLVPGLAWSLAAFPLHRKASQPPAKGSLDLAERGAYALGLSLAVVSVGAIAWSGVLHLPLGSLGSTLLVATLSLPPLGIWQWRLRAKPAAAAGARR